ncbi:putative ABC transporter ATP-binding protein [compost metagenome]
MEMEIIKDILSITDSKTAIIVTHRLACCRFVDEIIVLENGKLIEQGDHDSLLRKNGKYAEMFNSQLSMYKDNNDEEFRSLPLSVGSI